MKVRLLVCVFAVCFAMSAFAGEGAALKDKKDRVSYMVGVDIAKTLKKQSVDVNIDIVREAMRDVQTGAKLRLTDEEMADIKGTLEKEIGEQRKADAAAIAEKNRKEEEKFLAENKTKQGVVTLPSGLQYQIIKQGTGEKPKADDMVSAHYRVMKLDGTEIESSYKKPAPESFSLENVVPGWREGACLMPAGSKWRLWIPSKLAYGEDGVGEIVGPNTMLVFDLELVQILDKPSQTLEEKPAPENRKKAD